MKIQCFSNRGTRLYFLLCILIIYLFFIESCGIYTATEPLNPPYGQHRDGNTSITFLGYNTESYFKGYIIWYKGDDDIDYEVCEYNGKADKPSIPMSPGPLVTTHQILFQDLGHQIEKDDFKVLLDDNKVFQFAVSSYGIKDGNEYESEKVLF